MEWYLARNKAEEGPAHEKLKRLASEFRILFRWQWGAITAF